MSRYEGDLVAKCYFAKRKLVWEVLNGGLKSKIEIQWSDITAIKAACPDNGPGSLDLVVLSSKQLKFLSYGQILVSSSLLICICLLPVGVKAATFLSRDQSTAKEAYLVASNFGFYWRTSKQTQVKKYF